MLELNRSIRSNAEWREQVSACKASGITGVEYARVHGLNVKSFYNARRRLGSRSMGDGPSKPELFKRVEVTGDARGARQQ
ncbi:MAG: IS66 family insertion sequence element accessory protein TnpA [Chromatiales bacterium]